MKSKYRDIIKKLALIMSAKSDNQIRLIIDCNRSDELFISTVSYLIGKIPSGITVNNIDKPIFYKAFPQIINDWKELLDYYRTNLELTDEKILITQAFIREQPYEERCIWKAIITRSIIIRCDSRWLKIKEINDESLI